MHSIATFSLFLTFSAQAHSKEVRVLTEDEFETLVTQVEINESATEAYSEDDSPTLFVNDNNATEPESPTILPEPEDADVTLYKGEVITNAQTKKQYTVLGPELNSGGMGDIYPVESRSTGNSFAFKVYHGAVPGNIITEINRNNGRLAVFCYRNTCPKLPIVKTISTGRFFKKTGETFFGLVTEYIPSPNVPWEQLQNLGTTMNEIERSLDILSLWINKSMALVKYLASHGFAHNDIKPGNFFRKRQQIALSDFDLMTGSNKQKKLSLRFRPDSPQARPRTLGYTLLHGAPEVISRSSPTTTSDLFSLASSLHEIIFGYSPSEEFLKVGFSLDSEIPNDRRLIGHLLDRLIPDAFATRAFRLDYDSMSNQVKLMALQYLYEDTDIWDFRFRNLRMDGNPDAYHKVPFGRIDKQSRLYRTLLGMIECRYTALIHRISMMRSDLPYNQLDLAAQRQFNSQKRAIIERVKRFRDLTLNLLSRNPAERKIRYIPSDSIKNPQALAEFIQLPKKP